MSPAFIQDSVRLIAKIRDMEPQEIAEKTCGEYQTNL